MVSDHMPSLVTGLPEKFRRYECSDCQVCPFNPRTETRPLPALILWYFFGTVLALLRLMLLVICIAFAIFFETLGHLFSFIPSLRKFIRFIGVSLPCRAMLFLFGFTSVSASNVNVPAQQKVKLPSRIFASVKAGSVVISNLVSVSEILYFEYALSPVYALPSASGKNVIQCSLYRIICHVIFDSIPKTAEMSLSELQDVASRQRQPVLLFAEGHPSNGKAMLPFADVAHEVSLCNCAVVSVEGWRWKPVSTVDGGWTYLFSLLVQPTLSLSVKCIPQDCLAFLAHCSDATHRTHMVTAHLEHCVLPVTLV